MEQSVNAASLNAAGLGFAPIISCHSTQRRSVAPRHDSNVDTTILRGTAKQRRKLPALQSKSVRPKDDTSHEYTREKSCAVVTDISPKSKTKKTRTSGHLRRAPSLDVYLVRSQQYRCQQRSAAIVLTLLQRRQSEGIPQSETSQGPLPTVGDETTFGLVLRLSSRKCLVFQTHEVHSVLTQFIS